MTYHNYISLHFLTLFPFSNPNRDDMGKPKEMMFGDSLRQRISSQSLKYAYRQGMDNKSIRSKNLFVEIYKILKKDIVDITEVDNNEQKYNTVLFILLLNFLRKFSKDTILSWLKKQIFTQNKQKYIKPLSQWNIEDVSELKERAMTIWSQECLEIFLKTLTIFLDEENVENVYGRLSETIAQQNGTVTDGVLKTIEQILLTTNQDNNEHPCVFSDCDIAILKDCTSSVTEKLNNLVTDDVAFFGRMTAGNSERTMEASVSVSHAMSVTPFKSGGEVDYFTAVDSLQENGSGHLDSKYMASSVFYHCVVINRTQLKKNLKTDNDSEINIHIEKLIKIMTQNPPLGMIASSCSYQMPDFICVVKSNSAAVAYPAFEKSIKGQHEEKNVLTIAADRLISYLDAMIHMYNMDEAEVCDLYNGFSIKLPENKKIKSVGSLKELLQFSTELQKAG